MIHNCSTIIPIISESIKKIKRLKYVCIEVMSQQNDWQVIMRALEWREGKGREGKGRGHAVQCSERIKKQS